MKRTGFTLLELLIVVLIIGILVSVAYPSFRLAVWKTRVAKLLPLGRDISERVKLFYLTNGNYPTDDDLEGMLPARFQLQEKGWSDGDLTVYCAQGHPNDEPSTCDTVSLWLRGNDRMLPMGLFFYRKTQATTISRHTASSAWQTRN